MSNQINNLPELIRPKQARELLGVSQKKYYTIVQAVPDLIVKLPGERSTRVRKSALIAHFRLA